MTRPCWNNSFTTLSGAQSDFCWFIQRSSGPDAQQKDPHEPKQTEQIPTRTREVIGLETWQRMRDSFAVSSVEAGVDITNQVSRVSCTSSGIMFQTVSHVYLCESGFYEPEPQLVTCSTLQLLNNCLRFMYRLHAAKEPESCEVFF